MTFDQLYQLVESYTRQQKPPLPTTLEAATKDVHAIMAEIDTYRQEGHAPDHQGIVWRVAHLMFCVRIVERLGDRSGLTHFLVSNFLEQIGVPLTLALELAAIRLQALCDNKDIEHVDRYVLVPLMRQGLHQLCP